MLQRRKSPSSKLEKDPRQVHRQHPPQSSQQLRFAQHIATTPPQPDVIISEYSKPLIMLELIVPWEEKIEGANERKGAKYQELVEERQGTLSPWAKLQRNHEVAMAEKGRSIACYWETCRDLITLAGSPGGGCLMLRDPKHPVNPGNITDDAPQYIHEMFIPPGTRRVRIVDLLWNPCNLDFIFWCMFLRHLTLNLVTSDLQNSKYDVYHTFSCIIDLKRHTMSFVLQFKLSGC